MTIDAPHTDDWVALTAEVLDVGRATEWATMPGCGAIVVFSGVVRDHADGTVDVTHIDYEAWPEQVLPRLAEIAADMRRRWSTLGRIVLWHRDGVVHLGESSVVVAVSAPHRGEAFDAAEHGIDTLKAVLPIWKKEHWAGGATWARASQPITEVADLASDGVTR